jgi:hypothetical protein
MMSQVAESYTTLRLDSCSSIAPGAGTQPHSMMAGQPGVAKHAVEEMVVSLGPLSPPYEVRTAVTPANVPTSTSDRCNVGVAKCGLSPTFNEVTV